MKIKVINIYTQPNDSDTKDLSVLKELHFIERVGSNKSGY